MTRQIAEKLTYNGQKYEMHTKPLSPYLAEHPIELSGRTHIERTDCWRGYVGHWAIEDDKLYLVDLDSFEIPHRNALYDLFPGQQKVFAEWFSGTISTVSDKKYMYFEFKIENGCLIEVEKKKSKYIGVGHDSTFDLSGIVKEN